jgi:hypothetical protein
MKRSPLKRKPYSLKRTPLRAKRKGIRKVTKLPLGKLKKSLLELAKRHVRERDERCMMAGANGRACGGGLQASHIFPEGIYHSMKFDPQNMIAACYGHHIGWWHKSPLEAHNWLKEHLGEEQYNYLFKLRDAYKQKQWFIPELTELLALAKQDLSNFDKHYKPYRPAL